MVDGWVALQPRERLDHLRRPGIEAAHVPAVEDRARLRILGIVGRHRLLMPAQRRLHLRRQLRPQAVRLADEVRERRGSVGEHERVEPARLRKCVLLREKATPRLAEHVMPLAHAERIDEVVKLAHEQINRPEIGSLVGKVRAPPVAELVVVDYRPPVAREIRQRQ